MIFLDVLCNWKRKCQLLRCPIIPAGSSHEIVSDGPVSIFHYTDNVGEHDEYAFQVRLKLVDALIIEHYAFIGDTKNCCNCSAHGFEVN